MKYNVLKFQKGQISADLIIKTILHFNAFSTNTAGSEDGSGLTCNGTGGSVVPTAYPPSASNISYSIHLQISPQKQGTEGFITFSKLS